MYRTGQTATCGPYDSGQWPHTPLVASLQAAPIGRRFAAGLVDAVVVLGGLAVAGVSAWKLRHRLQPIASAVGEWVGPRVKARVAEPDASFELNGSRRAALTTLILIGVVLARNLRSPGSRLLGLRKVELRDGQPVSVRSAVIHYAVEYAQSALLARVFKPFRRRHFDALDMLRPELKRLQEEHRHDPEALQQAIMQLYREHRVNPLMSCAWVIPPILVGQAPRLWSPYRLTLPDQLAGTVIIVEPRAPRTRSRTRTGRSSS